MAVDNKSASDVGGDVRVNVEWTLIRSVDAFIAEVVDSLGLGLVDLDRGSSGYAGGSLDVYNVATIPGSVVSFFSEHVGSGGLGVMAIDSGATWDIGEALKYKHIYRCIQYFYYPFVLSSD